MSHIATIKAVEILDSRGTPTLQVTVKVATGQEGTASVPSGASTGALEAKELRDADPHRYRGKGVLKAIAQVEGPIASLLQGKSVFEQKLIDQAMLDVGYLGANAVLGVSLAVAKAAAICCQKPLYAYLQQGPISYIPPRPMMNVINGGVHADSGLAFQEFMIRPKGAPSFAEALRWGVEIFWELKDILHAKGHTIAVGDEGGFAPRLSSEEEALDLLMEAVEKAGYKPGEQIFFALDVAASSFYDPKTFSYLGNTSKSHIQKLQSLVDRYPIDSIEDGMGEEDWEGWKMLTECLGHKIQIVGDDLFVTNTSRLQRGIHEKIANAILIKPNQIGTLTQTLECIELAKKNGYQTIISHRSGETEDTFIADLCIGVQALHIKTGSLCRSERVAKYNRLLTIERERLSFT